MPTMCMLAISQNLPCFSSRLTVKKNSKELRVNIAVYGFLVQWAMEKGEWHLNGLWGEQW